MLQMSPDRSTKLAVNGTMAAVVVTKDLRYVPPNRHETHALARTVPTPIASLSWLARRTATGPVTRKQVVPPRTTM